VVFRILTRRLQRLAGAMDRFRGSDFTAPLTTAPQPAGAARDEIDRLAVTFSEMAARIAAQIRALKKTDFLRRELVAQVSHDLRTPLASLHGFLETLQLKGDALSTAERSEYLAVALRQSERLGRLVEDLFELARLDAGEIQPTVEPFAMTELAQDVVQKLTLRAREQGVELHFSVAGQVPFVAADIGLLERVLENLLDNALSHTPSPGVVHLQVDHRRGRVQVRVSDSGEGIAAANLPRIFERFFRVRGDRYDRAHAGLGLAIAKRILDLHGAPIDVSSREGRGTTFSFELPVWEGA
jgi:signal transduction histidine kinase